MIVLFRTLLVYVPTLRGIRCTYLHTHTYIYTHTTHNPATVVDRNKRSSICCRWFFVVLPLLPCDITSSIRIGGRERNRSALQTNNTQGRLADRSIDRDARRSIHGDWYVLVGGSFQFLVVEAGSCFLMGNRSVLQGV